MFDLNLNESPKTENLIFQQPEKRFNLAVDRNALVKALAHVQNIVEKRNIIPILANVKLVAKNGKLELTSTDMDISASEKIIAHILDEGAVTIPAHMVYDIARKLPDGSTITIKISDKLPGKLDIFTENCNFSLSYLDASEFPSLDQGLLPFKFKLLSTELKSIIDKNKFAISNEETRYNLNGIYLHVNQKDNLYVLNAVATDGHRLSCFTLMCPEGAEKMPGIIVPKKTVLELRKIIEDTELDITIELSDSKIKFSFGEVEIISKLIDGNFPEYSALIPQECSTIMEINKKKFQESIDRVTSITFDKTRVIKLKINTNEIEFTVNNDEKGEAKEISECQSNAKNFEIGFNSKYLLDVLTVIDGDVAVLSFTDTFSPAMIRDKFDNSSTFVVMPMRI